MKYQLLKPINRNYSTIEQILTNRNIPIEDVYHYLNTTDEDINEPELLGEFELKTAVGRLINHIKNNDKTFIIVDCDCDGFTSSALLLNYLHNLFPSYVKNNITYYFHEGKEHGLADCIEKIKSDDFRLIIVPDAGSNDIKYHKIITDNGADIIILDHHIIEEKVEGNAIIINNQSSKYPNKEFSGVGIVWQFCRYIDNLLHCNFANNYLDLVALGNTGDMMSLTSIETKHLINKGFKPENIKNPYIFEMWQKNKFKLGEHISSIDAAFYIVPMINAVQRSGTIEEKILLFNSILQYKAFEKILSNKRGHKEGELERTVDQAVRMSTNVKNRQTRIQDAAMEMLEQWIKEDNMLEHKVLVFLLESGKIDKNIAGLIANKIANKYQRPCCILTKSDPIPNIRTYDWELSNPPQKVPIIESVENLFQGSARGFELTGVTNFKDICDEAGAEWTAGHQNAFGLCVKEENIQQFIANIDLMLINLGISTEPIYYVDYIFNNMDVNYNNIMTIASLKDIWGKDMNEAIVAVEGLKLTKNMINIYRKTSNTLKISINDMVSLVKFNATDEECEKLENYDGAYLELNLVGRCARNEFNGWITAQILIEDYEIVGKGRYLF